MLELVRLNADEGVILAIVGKSERPYIKNFTKQDAKGIKQVIIKTANPMLRTTAGRMEIASQAIQNFPGRFTYEQWIELLTTGQVTPAFSEPVASVLRVAWENEQFMSGTVKIEERPAIDPMTGGPKLDMMGKPVIDRITPDVPVIAGDPPNIHIPEHYAQLCDPEVMRDPAKRDPLLAHLLCHLKEARATDPLLAAAMHWSPEIMGAIQAGMPQPAPAADGGDDVSEPPDDPKVRATAKETDHGVPLPKPPGATALQARNNQE